MDSRRVAPTAAVALAGCSSATADRSGMWLLRPAGQGVAGLAQLFWFLLITSAIVYVIVIAIMIAAIVRKRSAPDLVDLSPKKIRFVAIGGAVIPTAILVLTFVVGLSSMQGFPVGVVSRPVTYRVVGHQWWWEVEYTDPVSAQRFWTANEIHVPVGRPIRIILTSTDVIHSFWVPQLQGKIDLIPGDTNDIRFIADRPGTYRGQCAEYCGMQHAHMALVVVAEDEPSFGRWLAVQYAPAVVPKDSIAAMGEHLVTTGACAGCHTIRGTPAGGRVGPDLTHVGSRRTIAAGMLANSLGTLEAWITTPQAIKPGSLMPSLMQFRGDELRAMATYLETLR